MLSKKESYSTYFNIIKDKFHFKNEKRFRDIVMKISSGKKKYYFVPIRFHRNNSVTFKIFDEKELKDEYIVWTDKNFFPNQCYKNFYFVECIHDMSCYSETIEAFMKHCPNLAYFKE